MRRVQRYAKRLWRPEPVRDSVMGTAETEANTMLYDSAAWLVITGLALMVMGGLTVWAYGARPRGTPIVLTSSGPESEATQRFHVKTVRWYRAYGMAMTAIGGVLLLSAAVVLL